MHEDVTTKLTNTPTPLCKTQDIYKVAKCNGNQHITLLYTHAFVILQVLQYLICICKQTEYTSATENVC